MKSYAKQFDESDEIPARKRKAGKTITRRESKKLIDSQLKEDLETAKLIDFESYGL